MAQNLSGVVRQASTLSILWGVLLICLGVLAVASPMLAAVAVTAFISWLIVFAGVVHLIVAFHAREAGSVIWRLLVGLAYICFGVYLIAHPAIGVASLTLVLASLFLVEGILDIVMFFRVRTIMRAGWILLDGIVTLLLGLLIYVHWPSSSAWAIGTLVGVSMILSGMTRLMVSFAIRKAAGRVPAPPSSLAA
ncbi:MAG TPA: HdeD family acid-resistance protein [Candidatus Binatia bacterium]|nr:HdeD family acid-resistance protein [Candidatus Binatia bacterium]